MSEKKCPCCGKEMSDKEYIAYLENKVKSLEAQRNLPKPTTWPMTFGPGDGPLLINTNKPLGDLKSYEVCWTEV